MNPTSAAPHASLLYRLRRALLLLALAPLLLGFAILLASYGMDKHADLKLTYERRTAQLAEMTQNYVLETQDHLGQATRFWNYGALPAAEQSRILHDILAAHEEFVAIDYLSPEGKPRLRAERSDTADERQRHWQEEPAVTQALSSGEVVFGQVTIDPATAEPALTMAMPVKAPGNGPIVGLFAAKLTFRPVWQEFGRLVRMTPDDAFVLSAQQRLVAHVNPSLVLAGTRYETPAASGVHRDLQGRLALVTIRQVPLPGNTLTVVLTRPLVSAYGVILVGIGIGLAMMLAAISLALLLLRHLEQWLLNPVEILTEAAERIRADEKDVRVQGKFDGEVAILAETFNLMIDRLHTEQTVLEQRVQERTLSLSQARDEADRANHAKSDFLSSMSHELRTPLNAVIGFAQILEYDKATTPDQQDNVNEILKAGRHLLDLINEVLDLAKIESGHIDLSMEGIDLPALGEDCRHLIQPIAEKAGIRLGFGLPPGSAVFADRVRLKQVLLNLLSNAIKYNRPGGSAQLSLAPGKPGHLRIAVSDTGFGIPPERQAELFQPFNRLGAESSKIEGTGIGLTITRRLVEMMGGEVGVESTVDVGSTFWLELAVGRMANVGAGRTAGDAAAASLAPQHTATVLAIDDNPVNLKLIAQIMGKRKGIHLISAHTPELGIELALAHRPNLILLDINMPGMDGYQVLSILKANPLLQSIPVVAVTANAMPRDIDQGKRAGFAEYLTKPLDIDHFLQVADALLDATTTLPPVQP